MVNNTRTGSAPSDCPRMSAKTGRTTNNRAVAREPASCPSTSAAISRSARQDWPTRSNAVASPAPDCSATSQQAATRARPDRPVSRAAARSTVGMSAPSSPTCKPPPVAKNDRPHSRGPGNNRGLASAQLGRQRHDQIGDVRDLAITLFPREGWCPLPNPSEDITPRSSECCLGYGSTRCWEEEVGNNPSHRRGKHQRWRPTRLVPSIDSWDPS